MCTDQGLHSLRVHISRVYCTKSQFRTYQTPTMDKYHNWSFWRWIIVNIPWNINIENQTIFLTNDCWPNFSIKLTNSLDSVLSQAVLIIICIVVWPFVKAEKIHKMIIIFTQIDNLSGEPVNFIEKTDLLPPAVDTPLWTLC